MVAAPALVKSAPKIQTFEWDGRRITKPGLYSLVPMDSYHLPDICDGPSISSSGLRKINPDIGSPKHFFATWPGNPESVPEPDSRAFILGRAVHHLMLGEKMFAKLFIVQPDEYVNSKTGEVKPWSNNATDCKKWNTARAKEGRSILTPKEVHDIKGMAIEIGKHPLARQFLSGQIERSFFWKDKETGIWLKWRPDALPTDALDFADLKTSYSVHFPDLVQILRNRAYYQQAALGRTACQEVLKQEMSTFTLVFVEKTYPWAVRDERLFDEDLVRGGRMNRACLRTFASCMKSGIWPGPGAGNEGNERLPLSGAAREQIDKRLEMEGLADGH